MDESRAARAPMPAIDDIEVPSIILIERAYQRTLHDMLCRDAGIAATEGAEIETDHIRPRFDPFGDERVKRGDPNWNADDVRNNFFAVLDDSGDGKTSDAEFMRLYENVSPAIDDDADFKKMLEEFWPPLGDREGGGRIRGAFSKGHGYCADPAAHPGIRATDEREQYLDGILDMADELHGRDVAKRLDSILDKSRDVIASREGRAAPRRRPAQPEAPPPPRPAVAEVVDRAAAVDRSIETAKGLARTAKENVRARKAAAPSSLPKPIAAPKSSLGGFKAAAKLVAKGAAAPKMAGGGAGKKIQGPPGQHLQTPTNARRQSGWGAGHFDSYQKHRHL